MASDFACLGMPVADEPELVEVVNATLPHAVEIGRGADGERVLRWDDASGARITYTIDASDRLVGVTPLYAGEAGARLSWIEPLNARTVIADVVDEADETLTRASLEAEQHALLPAPRAEGAAAAVTAFVADVAAFPTEAAFAASPRSALSPGFQRRMSSQSFLSRGVWGDPATASAAAQLSGTVLGIAERRNGLTGTAFTVVRLRTWGMQLDLCAPAGLLDAAPGGVVAGLVVLAASIPSFDTLP